MARRNGGSLSTNNYLVIMIYMAAILLQVPSSIIVRGEVDEVPMVFIFGDSVFDVGTNNFLNTKARADFKFNGIDYRGSQPTGRFSNGYNTADFIVKLMGYKRSPPPFLSLVKDKRKNFFKRNVLGGVNFASGGSGILRNTGKKFGRVISLGEQIQQFSTVATNITELMGKPKADSLLSRAFFLISVGGNDLFDLFFNNSKITTTNLDNFLSNLLFIYKTHLKSLVNLGARRIGVVSIPPIGCCPISRLRSMNGSCDELMNDSAQSFFIGLESIFEVLQTEFVGLQYSLGNSYLMTESIILNPLTFRFKEVEKACCGNGTLNAESQCVPSAEFCRERNDYLFWDRFHPTQAAAELAARTLFAGSPPFVTPFNFSHLTQVYL